MSDGTFKMDTEVLSTLYGDGVDMLNNVQQAADDVMREIQRLKNSDAFEGQQGDDAREVMTNLSTVMEGLVNNGKILNKFLDEKIGKIIEEAMKKNYSGVSDKVKALIQKRLKK